MDANYKVEVLKALWATRGPARGSSGSDMYVKLQAEHLRGAARLLMCLYSCVVR